MKVEERIVFMSLPSRSTYFKWRIVAYTKQALNGETVVDLLLVSVLKSQLSCNLINTWCHSRHNQSHSYPYFKKFGHEWFLNGILINVEEALMETWTGVYVKCYYKITFFLFVCFWAVWFWRDISVSHQKRLPFICNSNFRRERDDHLWRTVDVRHYPEAISSLTQSK
jgi:hypothetical protein